jgi:hypothetical protein
MKCRATRPAKVAGASTAQCSPRVCNHGTVMPRMIINRMNWSMKVRKT